MKIVAGLPPNFAKIAAALPGARTPNAIFCYGDTVYVANGQAIPRWLADHEAVHAQQQSIVGLDKWWDLYIDDPRFRFSQEIDAHRTEWRSWMVATGGTWRNRADRRRYMRICAGRLSGSLYGSLASFDEAKRLILAEGAP